MFWTAMISDIIKTENYILSFKCGFHSNISSLSNFVPPFSSLSANGHVLPVEFAYFPVTVSLNKISKKCQ